MTTACQGWRYSAAKGPRRSDGCGEKAAAGTDVCVPCHDCSSEGMSLVNVRSIVSVAAAIALAAALVAPA
ncbi:MAG: hypothetical protein VW929_08090, partial [Actinomycetota bacterium]